MSGDSTNVTRSNFITVIRDLLRRVRRLEAVRPLTAVDTAAQFDILVFGINDGCPTGDGAFKFPVPQDLNLCSLVAVECGVNTASATGDIEVSLYNDNTAQDMLSVPMMIQQGERSSVTSGQPGTIDPANAVVNTPDEFIWVNIDQGQPDGLGLVVILTFSLAPLP